jgi:hypothetical protein
MIELFENEVGCCDTPIDLNQITLKPITNQSITHFFQAKHIISYGRCPSLTRFMLRSNPTMTPYV